MIKTLLAQLATAHALGMAAKALSERPLQPGIDDQFSKSTPLIDVRQPGGSARFSQGADLGRPHGQRRFRVRSGRRDHKR